MDAMDELEDRWLVDAECGCSGVCESFGSREGALKLAREWSESGDWECVKVLDFGPDGHGDAVLAWCWSADKGICGVCSFRSVSEAL